MDHTLMKDKKEKQKVFEDGNQKDSEEAKALLYGIDTVHVFYDFPLSVQEVKALETVGQHYNLNISVINSKGIQDEDDEEEEEEMNNEDKEDKEEEEGAEDKPKDTKVQLEKDTETARVLKAALVESKLNSFTLHKFILDAERDEANELI